MPLLELIQTKQFIPLNEKLRTEILNKLNARTNKAKTQKNKTKIQLYKT